MSDNLQSGILLIVSILLFISFTTGLWTRNEDDNGAPASPLLLFDQ
ncbi:hypothetical protein [Bacillus suaedae]|uniref:Uncharacterized protein n=1 Tax=Halalkalibacter suaedae TaxID=2822140 RepID=A0A940WN60_9BACI|nr:hypothetical protein [Bacillus suaedae]MBP3949534.1 hypothetical protein [Bacillus suaedae]